LPTLPNWSLTRRNAILTLKFPSNLPRSAQVCGRLVGMTKHHCPSCDALLPNWPAQQPRVVAQASPTGIQSPQLDPLVALAGTGYEFTTKEFHQVCGFRTPNLMAKALRLDPRFTSRKSGVIRWKLAQ
jgi:hypothetical protein